MNDQVHVERLSAVLMSDDKRVIPRYLNFGDAARIQRIVDRAVKIPNDKVDEALDRVRSRFSCRHRDLEAAFVDHFRAISRYTRKCGEIDEAHRLLIGAYFTLEYSIESAALFNPSIVPHPDQSGLQEDELRFLMSLRATGEGHLSSICFRRGVIGAKGSISFDPPPRYAYPAKARRNRQRALSRLESIINECMQSRNDDQAQKMLAEKSLWMMTSNYDLNFPADCQPAEIVIFPASKFENRGMEDLRLVRFVDDTGTPHYYGTYTAYDGMSMRIMMLETTDFHRFQVSPIEGRFAKNKGLALFPRKINGYYYAISRHDGESLFVLRSKTPYRWNSANNLMKPEYEWELVQLGNCGSPIETEEGWLLITHGVGPMREYSIGVVLLDLENPRKVIGRMKYPLLCADETEREGYVPNVVYSCGSILHHGKLVIPYAMSDSRTAFASVDLGDLLSALRR